MIDHQESNKSKVDGPVVNEEKPVSSTSSTRSEKVERLLSKDSQPPEELPAEISVKSLPVNSEPEKDDQPKEVPSAVSTPQVVASQSEEVVDRQESDEAKVDSSVVIEEKPVSSTSSTRSEKVERLLSKDSQPQEESNVEVSVKSSPVNSEPEKDDETKEVQSVSTPPIVATQSESCSECGSETEENEACKDCCEKLKRCNVLVKSQADEIAKLKAELDSLKN